MGFRYIENGSAGIAIDTWRFWSYNSWWTLKTSEYLECPGGGIGRRARLRGVWFTPYEFKSRPGHHFYVLQLSPPPHFHLSSCVSGRPRRVVSCYEFMHVLFGNRLHASCHFMLWISLFPCGSASRRLRFDPQIPVLNGHGQTQIARAGGELQQQQRARAYR